MKANAVCELEYLQNAVNYHQLSKFNLSLHEKHFEDKRKTTKMFFLNDAKTGGSISPVLDYENMNHFIHGFSQAVKMLSQPSKP